jgi:3-hydroxyisobutyrate dehydrogenase-like beta-hydroxyacid dehydrogenase
MSKAAFIGLGAMGSRMAGGDDSVPTVSAARDVFQKAINEKLGDLNMTAVVKLFEKNN